MSMYAEPKSINLQHRPVVIFGVIQDTSFFRSMANLSPWPGLKFRPSAQIEQLNNFVESVIKTFKSIDLMLNVVNLLAREL